MTISDSLDFLGPDAETDRPLLVSSLLDGIGVKIFHLTCEGCERCFAVGFSRLDVCRESKEAAPTSQSMDLLRLCTFNLNIDGFY